jgi:glycosyltransferase involved in cell wall biosynthesis
VKAVEFWSSVEHAAFQKGLITALAASGWEAEHRYGISQAEYWAARSRPARLGLRARAYGAYPLRVLGRFLGARRGRVGVVSTNTFFAPGVAALAAGRRGMPMIHWVFDLFPDVLVTAGALRAGGAAERAIRGVVRSTFERAAANVFLGRRLLAHAEEQHGPIPRAVVIPVGCDATLFHGSPPAERPPGAPLSVLYNGNLGRMHDGETVAAALRAGLPEGLTIEFRGNGPVFRQLQAALRPEDFGGRLSFGGNVAEREWVAAMGRADIGLVTMKPGAEGVVMPSKAYSAMAAGQAVLAVCPAQSDLADTVREHGCGWVIAPGDAEGLSALLRRLASEPGAVFAARQRSWQAGQAVFDQRILAVHWRLVLDAALNRAA